MSNVISTRMKKEEIEILNRISNKEHIDRSALMRKFLLQQITEYKMKNASEKYRKGVVSLAEAATMADVLIYDMIEYCQREKITAPSLSEEEMLEEFESANIIFSKIKEGKIK
ncbi:MAG: hypothetical protein ACTSYU_02450 [Promethearchaeota archaeon]